MRLTLLLAALLASASLSAQSPPAPPDPAAHEAKMMDNLAVLLDLTDAQRPQVQAILKDEHAKIRQSMDQAHAGGAMPDHAQLKALHEQIHQDAVQRLTPVLSPLQLQKFEILSEMHMHAAAMHMHHGAAGAHPQG
ncbi:MAG: hypothetical protein JO341_08885 [Gammaproteobacteria bacterium]|nr:hypothetical protein [Gammaproteobacteria bacterium]MBV9621124.1 hypothetical protein [Gammaproteobacteria bacterium]